jgi:hypothetical protein
MTSSERGAEPSETTPDDGGSRTPPTKRNASSATRPVQQVKPGTSVLRDTRRRPKPTAPVKIVPCGRKVRKLGWPGTSN